MAEESYRLQEMVNLVVGTKKKKNTFGVISGLMRHMQFGEILV